MLSDSRNPIISSSGPIATGPFEKLEVALWDLVDNEKSNVLGRILTIVDASVIDPQQNKAMKDLIKSVAHEQNTYWHESRCVLLATFIEKHAPMARDGKEVNIPAIYKSKIDSFTFNI